LPVCFFGGRPLKLYEIIQSSESYELRYTSERNTGSKREFQISFLSTPPDNLILELTTSKKLLFVNKENEIVKSIF